jgi:hypothetical protein
MGSPEDNEISRLEFEIEGLKEALAFYANDDNYKHQPIKIGVYHVHVPIITDNGKKARAVLKKQDIGA